MNGKLNLVGRGALAALALLIMAGVAAAAEGATTQTQTSTLAGLDKSLPAIKAGQMAPDFKCVTLAGDEASLKTYKGKYVLIEFWAVWCGWCTRETPAMKAIAEEFGKDKRFAILGLNLDKDLARLEAYLERTGIKWPQAILGDWAHDKVTAAYGIREIPTMLLVDPSGKVLAVAITGKAIREAIVKALGPQEAKK